MSGRLLTAKEVIAAALPHGESRHEAAVVNRITDRVLRATIEDARFDHVVHGGFFGVIPTLHGPETYKEVADRLTEEAELEIEAHRFQFITPYMLGPEGLIPARVVDEFDKISVLSLGGTAVERTQQPSQGDEHVAQLYPPVDVAGMHNLSLGPPNLN